jgi:hypothetical protein
VKGQATPQGLSSPLPEVRRINEAAATGGKANVADFAMLGLRAEAAKRAKGEATPSMKYTPPAGGNPYVQGRRSRCRLGSARHRHDAGRLEPTARTHSS